MTDAVIVAATRTPIGTAFKGSLVDVDAFELGTLVVREAVDRAGIDPDLLDDVALGETLYGGGDHCVGHVCVSFTPWGGSWRPGRTRRRGSRRG